VPAIPTAARAPSPLDRALRLVGEVRPGEGAKAAVLGTSLFLLLASYYLLKVVRESLILSSYDAEVKVYVSAGQAVLLIPAVMAFGWLSSRMGRFRLVVSATLFFAANLVIFAVLYAIEVPIALPFYVWVGIFNVFVISQLWAFATDVYSETDGKRLFAVIGLGASLGAIVGAYAAEPVGDAIGTFGIFGLANAKTTIPNREKRILVFVPV
jgi:AAA family ATP:ADP antiporter